MGEEMGPVKQDVGAGQTQISGGAVNAITQGQAQTPDPSTVSALNALIQESSNAINIANASNEAIDDGASDVKTVTSESAFSRIDSQGQNQGGGGGRQDGEKEQSGSETLSSDGSGKTSASSPGYGFSQMQSGTGAAASELEAQMLQSSYMMAKAAQETEVDSVTQEQVGAVDALDAATTSANDEKQAAVENVTSTLIESGFAVGGGLVGMSGAFVPTKTDYNQYKITNDTVNAKPETNPDLSPVPGGKNDGDIKMSEIDGEPDFSRSTLGSAEYDNRESIEKSGDSGSKSAADVNGDSATTTPGAPAAPDGTELTDDQQELLETGKISGDTKGEKTRAAIQDLQTKSKAGDQTARANLNTIRNKSAAGMQNAVEQSGMQIQRNIQMSSAVGNIVTAAGKMIATPFTLESATDTQASKLDAAQSQMDQTSIDMTKSSLSIGTSLMQAAQSFVGSALQSVLSCFVKNG